MEEHKRFYMLTDGEDVADLYIFGNISSMGQWYDDDPDRSAYNIVKELQDVKAPAINVHINSNGGEVSEGLAIFNTLRNSGKAVTTYCDGFACSAASIVFMAGTNRIMSPASLLMIHNAWTFAMGNSDELRKQADDLEKINQAAVEAYKTVAAIPEDQIKDLMDNETWIGADDALNYGFATEALKEDDSTEPQQNAMTMIKAQLLKKPNASVRLDKDTITQLAEGVKNALQTPNTPTVPKHEETWDEFIGG